MLLSLMCVFFRRMGSNYWQFWSGSFKSLKMKFYWSNVFIQINFVTIKTWAVALLENLPYTDRDMNCKHFLHQFHPGNRVHIVDQENQAASNCLLRYIVFDILFLRSPERSEQMFYKRNFKNTLQLLFWAYQWYPHIAYEVYIF